MNKDIFLFLNSFAGQNHILDMIFISFAKGTPYLFILIEVYLYFFAKRRNEAIYAFFSMIVALILNQTISILYFHNRPFMDGIGGVLLIKHYPDSSFPSDHTTFLFAIAFSLFLSKIRYSSILFIVALLGGLARVFVGVHYPFDIIGGVFTGFLGAGTIYIFRDKLKILNETIIKLTTFIHN